MTEPGRPERRADATAARRASLPRKALRQIAKRETIHMIDNVIDVPETSPAPPKQRVALRPATPAEVSSFLAHVVDKALAPRRQVESYVRSGYRCFVGVMDGDIVCWYWAADSTVPKEHRHPLLVRLGIELGAGDLYGFDLIVDPAFRGRGLGREFLEAIHESVRGMGYRRIVATVDENNTRARTLFGEHGYRPVRTFSSLRLLRVIQVSGGRVFVRNSRWSKPHPWDYRQVWPILRRSEAS